MLRLVHPRPFAVEVRSTTEFTAEREDIAGLAASLCDPSAESLLAMFMGALSREKVRGSLVIIRFPRRRQICGVFPLIESDGQGRVGVDFPKVWRPSRSEPALFILRPRFIAEALDGLVRHLTESEWRSDMVAFETPTAYTDRLADIKRYCHEGGVTAWRCDRPTPHEERLTLALSPIGACFVSGARWYDDVRGRCRNPDERNGAPSTAGSQ